jgi:hypothetical protein
VLWATVGCNGRVLTKNLLGTVLCFLALSALASAQAAVEGALTHGLSGAASATAGKGLGQIGNQLAGRLGQQTSNAVRPAVTTVRPGGQKAVKLPQAATTAVPAANGGPLIRSIQGGEPQQAKACVPQTSDKTSSDVHKESECGNTNAADKAAHPSEITLAGPK